MKKWKKSTILLKSNFFLLIIFLLFVNSLSRAAFSGLPSGGGYSASLGAGAAVGYQRSALQNNPGARDSVSWSLGLGTFKPQGLSDLRTYHFGGTYDWTKLGTGFQYYQFGIENLYLEQAFQAQLSWWPWGFLGFGVKGSTRKISISGYGHTTFPVFGFGSIWQPIDFVSFGAFYDGLGNKNDSQFLIPFYQLGFSVGTGESGRFFYDWRKRHEQSARTLIAQSLIIGKGHFEMIAGLATNPFQFSFGIFLSWEYLQIMQSLQHHDFLGLSLQSLLRIKSR